MDLHPGGAVSGPPALSGGLDRFRFAAALLVVAIRILASHFRWDLPRIKTE